MAREAIEQLRSEHGREASTVVLPVGGGGLLAGCGAWRDAFLAAVRPSPRGGGQRDGLQRGDVLVGALGDAQT